MRELVPTDWCDRHLKEETLWAEGQPVRVEAQWTSVMAVGVAYNKKAKPLTLQLCYDCASTQQNIGAWEDWFQAYGWVDRDENAPPHKPDKPKEPKVTAVPVAGPVVSGGPSTERFTCPHCGESKRGRTGTINHIVSVHGINKVQASHQVPPVGGSIECAVCRFLTTPGPGYRGHVVGDHGAKAWEKIQKAAAK